MGNILRSNIKLRQRVGGGGGRLDRSNYGNHSHRFSLLLLLIIKYFVDGTMYVSITVLCYGFI
jgi:hypothetical protein